MKYSQKTKVSYGEFTKRKLALYALFLTKLPSEEMINLEDQRDDSGLTDFVGMYLKKEFDYATNLSIIEAVDSIVISQMNNGGEYLEK